MRFFRPAVPAVLCLAIAAGGYTPARADDALAAVGWLGYGKQPDPARANCSGVLVAPQLVVTADHCLINPKSGQKLNPRGLTFAAGLSGSSAAAIRRGKAIWVAPKDPATLGNAAAAYSVGLLLLDRPITPDEALPLPIATDAPSPGTAVVTVGYPRSAPDRPVVQRDCRITLSAPPMIGIDCMAVSGFSGGAVLVRGAGIWMLQAVMVAEARGGADYRAIAHDLPPDILTALQP